MNLETRHRTKCLTVSFLTVLLFLQAGASDCNRTSVGKTPINDLGAANYLNLFQGGLYPNGSNQMPRQHALEGRSRALAIRPLDVNGNPSPNGTYVFLSIGMSNTFQEFSAFMPLAAAHPDVRSRPLVILNGASGGQDAETWNQPTDPNYDRIRDQILIPRGLSEMQVQALWVKVANRTPSVALPNQNADAYRLVRQMGDITRSIKTRYPNAKIVFLSSRIYAGYATTNLNPEPYAYESGFAVKWLIEAQIAQMETGTIDSQAGDMNYNTVAPWVAWGPYLWADGLNARSDGLIWRCNDLNNDGTHPSPAGRQKVADMLLSFLLTSPFSRPWFSTYPLGDVNRDGCVDDADLLSVLFRFGEIGAGFNEDLDGDGLIDDGDLLTILFSFAHGCT